MSPVPNIEQIYVVKMEKGKGTGVQGFGTNVVKSTSFMNNIWSVFKNTFVNVAWKVFITILY